MKCPRCDGTGKLPTLGELVWRCRIAKGWTQKQLAEAAACPETYIAHIEHGETDCSLDTLQRIAKAFGISAKDLIP